MNRVMRNKTLIHHLIKTGAIKNQKDLGEKMGYSNESSFSQVINEKVAEPKDFIPKLKNIMPELNDQWLIKGEGEMLKVPATLTVYSPTAEERNEISEGVDMSVLPVEIVEEIEAKVIAEVQPPYVPLTVARHPNLDVMEWLKKGNGRHVSSTFNIMSILNDTTFYTEVRSNAMSPALNQGEILFLKEFEEGFVFVDGSPYVIDTRSRGMLAFYLYDRGDYIEARPHNVRFETLKIEKSDVMRYYQILFHGSTWVATELPTGDCHRQVEKQTEQINSLIDQNGKTLQIIEDLIKK